MLTAALTAIALAQATIVLRPSACRSAAVVLFVALAAAAALFVPAQPSPLPWAGAFAATGAWRLATLPTGRLAAHAARVEGTVRAAATSSSELVPLTAATDRA